jgi:D-3-phosphoglycerate dehydrogenase / 2-oxoglutarate reductase
VTFRVLVTDYAWPDLEPERAVLAAIGAELVVAERGDEDELTVLAADADAILTCWKPVSQQVLEAAHRCVTVARYGVGLDNIDVAAATRLGIVVSHVPEFCTAEVADHTLALILAHARHVVGFAGETARGRWDNKAFGPMRRLRGRVLGLVGFGRVAREVASRAQAFGFDVLAFSRSTAGSPPAHGVRFAASLDEVLQAADVLSLHVPLTPGTRRLIGPRELRLMKTDAVLVNTSRGALVDEDALLAALRADDIAGAALDVLDGEPPSPGHPLIGWPTVVMTPHAAFDSVESIAELQDTAARNVAVTLTGGLPDALANPEVLTSAALRVGARR